MGRGTEKVLRVVRLIRHGESQANAGEPSNDPNLIGLTALGHQQALDVANSFLEPPDLIIHSPMARAVLTAKPTIERFPDVDVMPMEIQEFTYLDPERCKGTTAADRKSWVENYWNRCDIDYYDDGWGPWMSGRSRCESFHDFVKRTQSFISLLSEFYDYRYIAVFGHGQHLTRVQIEMMRDPVDTAHDGCWPSNVGKHGINKMESDMRVFPSLLREIHLGNAESRHRAWNGKGWINHKAGESGW